MIRLAGIENKEVITYTNPDDGKVKEWCRIAPIEVLTYCLIQPGAPRVPWTNILIADPAPTFVNPTIVTQYHDENQPFPDNKMVEVRKIDLILLQPLSDREAAAFMVSLLRMTVGNSKFDDRSVVDIVHSRTHHEMCLVEGIGAGCEGFNQFGTAGVSDVAAFPAFILDGKEDLVIDQVSLLPGGLVVDPGTVNVLDPLREQAGYVVACRVSGFHLGDPKSLDANAGRFAQIRQAAAQPIPASMAGANGGR